MEGISARNRMQQQHRHVAETECSSAGHAAAKATTETIGSIKSVLTLDQSEREVSVSARRLFVPANDSIKHQSLKDAWKLGFDVEVKSHSEEGLETSLSKTPNLSRWDDPQRDDNYKSMTTELECSSHGHKCSKQQIATHLARDLESNVSEHIATTRATSAEMSDSPIFSRRTSVMLIDTSGTETVVYSHEAARSRSNESLDLPDVDLNFWSIPRSRQASICHWHDNDKYCPNKRCRFIHVQKPWREAFNELTARCDDNLPSEIEAKYDRQVLVMSAYRKDKWWYTARYSTETPECLSLGQRVIFAEGGLSARRNTQDISWYPSEDEAKQALRRVVIATYWAATNNVTPSSLLRRRAARLANPRDDGHPRKRQRTDGIKAASIDSQIRETDRPAHSSNERDWRDRYRFLQSLVDEFARSARPGDVKHLSPELTISDRQIIHHEAEKLGLEHDSEGSGHYRHIVLSVPARGRDRHSPSPTADPDSQSKYQRTSHDREPDLRDLPRCDKDWICRKVDRRAKECPEFKETNKCIHGRKCPDLHILTNSAFVKYPGCKMFRESYFPNHRSLLEDRLHFVEKQGPSGRVYFTAWYRHGHFVTLARRGRGSNWATGEPWWYLSKEDARDAVYANIQPFM